MMVCGFKKFNKAIKLLITFFVKTAKFHTEVYKSIDVTRRFGINTDEGEAPFSKLRSYGPL